MKIELHNILESLLQKSREKPLPWAGSGKYSAEIKINSVHIQIIQESESYRVIISDGNYLIADERFINLSKYYKILDELYFIARGGLERQKKLAVLGDAIAAL